MRIARTYIPTILPNAIQCCSSPSLWSPPELDHYLWTKRVLEISAPSLTDSSYRAQAAELVPEWEGFVERDFVVRAKFGAKGFLVVLIGKDGKERLRSAVPLPPKELFAIVDAMPMRQAEMQKNAR